MDNIVDRSDCYKNKKVWKQKLYYIADYISQQNIANEYDIEKDYVNINEETMAKIIGVNNKQMATLLRDCVRHGLLRKDGIMKPAVKIVKGKQISYVEPGKSYGYQFMQFDHLVEVEVIESRSSDKHFRENRWEHSGKLIKGLEAYRQVLSNIRLDTSRTDQIIQQVLENKQKKKSQKEKYREFIEAIETEFYNRNNIECSIYPFAGMFVPVRNSTGSSMVCSYPDTSVYGVSVPEPTCSPCDKGLVFITSKRKSKAIKLSQEEKDETTIARCKRAIYIIENGLITPGRPVARSRVYSEITNLYREFREAILLNGKRIAGLDIANSQPLLATILIKEYWSGKHGYIPEDVKTYQEDCEAGMFYKNFMKALNVPDDLSAQFKKDFFQKVFFSMVIENNNVLKDSFMKKYPGCWEAICELKGGLYSNDYSEFATRLQKVEAQIIFDTVNTRLIEMGIDAFNIFDSIYVNNRGDLDTAKELTRQAFNEHGIDPTFHLEYSEHLKEHDEVSVECIADNNDEEQALLTMLDEMMKEQQRHRQEQEEIKLYYQDMPREKKLMWR